MPFFYSISSPLESSFVPGREELFMESSKKQIRWAVFLIPWILAIITIALNFISGDAFNAAIMTITGFILDDFSWLFSLMAFVCVVLIIMAYATPFGNVRIGGRNAKPIMNMSNYVWIVLCTIMAAGILLWACAEPMYHYYGPPTSIEPESPEAIEMRLSKTLSEIEYVDKYDYLVVNGVLDEAVNRVKAIIVAEHSKVTMTPQELIREYTKGEEE